MALLKHVLCEHTELLLIALSPPPQQRDLFCISDKGLTKPENHASLGSDDCLCTMVSVYEVPGCVVYGLRLVVASCAGSELGGPSER